MTWLAGFPGQMASNPTRQQGWSGWIRMDKLAVLGRRKLTHAGSSPQNKKRKAGAPVAYIFLGGRSKATASCSRCPLCAPSQKGLLFDNPHRHKLSRVLPARPYTLPWGSTISKSPSTLREPFEFTVILVAAIFSSFLSSKDAIIKQQNCQELPCCDRSLNKHNTKL